MANYLKIFTAFMLMNSGFGLKCILDGPTLSRTTHTCTGNQNVCASITGRVNGKSTYGLGCETVYGDCGVHVCRTLRNLLPSGSSLQDCKASCCTTDLCNNVKIDNNEHQGNGLTCFLEGPTISRTTHRCTGNQNACASITGVVNGKRTIGLGCETVTGDCEQSVCNTVRSLLPYGSSLQQCKVSCCKTNLCNNGVNININANNDMRMTSSVILLFFVSLVSFLFMIES